MKRLFFLTIALVFFFQATAQPGEPPHKARHQKEMNIENLVSDLSSTQKTRIDMVTRKSKTVVDGYRKELNAIRDSIRLLMDTPNDMSSQIFPLYEREAKLQAEISKEYYRAKVAVDKVLTPEQYKTLCTKIKQEGQRHNKHNHKK